MQLCIIFFPFRRLNKEDDGMDKVTQNYDYQQSLYETLQVEYSTFHYFP